MASGNASTSVLDLCSLSASASRETLRSCAVACPDVPTINSLVMLQNREPQRTNRGTPNYKSRATSILNLDLNIRAACLQVKSAHSSQTTLSCLLHQESSCGNQAGFIISRKPDMWHPHTWELSP